jgi:dipeptidyl aminopeptidase/acylaminoacyl peptidase
MRYQCFAVPLLTLATLAGAATTPVLAQDSAPGVTLEQIMAHPDWISRPPEEPFWADDGSAVYFQRKRTGVELRDLYRLQLDGGEPRLVLNRERGAVDVAGGDLSEDRAWKVYSRQGDIYLKDLRSGSIRQLTRTADAETAPRFLAGDSRVAYTRGGSVYIHELASGLISQAAELRLEKDPAEPKELGYLEEKEIRLFDVLRDRKEQREGARDAQRAEQKEDPTRAPLAWYLGEGIEIAETSLSPNGEWMLVITQPKGGGEPGKRPPMAEFVTESGYVETREVRPFVGTPRPANPTVLLLDLKKHEKHEIDLTALPGIHDDPLKELREKAAKAKEKGAKDSKDSKDGKDKKAKADEKPAARVLEMGPVVWSDDGSRVGLLFWSYDNKDRWIATLEPPSAKLVTRHRISDPAWVNEYDFYDFGWLKDNQTLWYLAEDTGYSHLYLLPTAEKGAKARALTRGKLEVNAPVLTRDGKSFYYRANATHPGSFDIFRVDVESGKSEQVSKMGGLTSYVLSPDESRLLLTNSQITRPDELFVQAAQPGAEPRRLTNTVSQAFLAEDWAVPEIVGVPSSYTKDPIWSRVYTPKDFDPKRKYPAVMFVHGAGYLQNAHSGWSTYFREFMFHTLLTQRGYVVIDMDYRASSGYGRDWRTAIYRQMGFPEVEDMEDGVAWLVRTKSVDPQRIGVYGGSYGGFLTFMALFRKPELFAAGAALRPVSDWSTYNHPYTANILNTPDVDPEAYTKSSPIEYAEGLNKPLLICSPMVDDNVLFQDSVRLVQRLIELKKENFETAIYPVEPHTFRQPTSWLDEYRRIFKLMETHVKPGRP